jgi:hypothetical protein
MALLSRRKEIVEHFQCLRKEIVPVKNNQTAVLKDVTDDREPELPEMSEILLEIITPDDLHKLPDSYLAAIVALRMRAKSGKK